MTVLSNQRDFRGIQRLPFCYLCSKKLLPNDETNRDHVVARRLFAPNDRQPTLILTVHKSCNSAQGDVDDAMSQLIRLKRCDIPSEPKDRRLKFIASPFPGLGAVVNLNIDKAVWRWIGGFHAALYREPYPTDPPRALVTPFFRIDIREGKMTAPPFEPQHRAFVETIKNNRARNNLDRILSNNGKLAYECVWCKADDGRWLCIFALDVDGWKVLGTTKHLPSRDCAGFYMLPMGDLPGDATTGIESSIALPNYEPLDPFGR
jgi:hypothetical protein